MQKSRALSAELQQEITVKIRFFRGAAKAAYLRTITSAVSEFAESEQVVDILAEPCTNPSASSPQTRDDIPCDIAQSEFLLQDAGDRANTRCMNISTDPEYKKLFDANIVSAGGYAVPGTAWENVE